MSWSVSGKGKPEEVAAQLEGQLATIDLASNPSEQSIFEAAKILLNNVVIGQDPEAVITVEAHGSQSAYGFGDSAPRITNSVSVIVTAEALEAPAPEAPSA